MARIQSLAWELPYATGAAKKEKEKSQYVAAYSVLDIQIQTHERPLLLHNKKSNQLGRRCGNDTQGSGPAKGMRFSKAPSRALLVHPAQALGQNLQSHRGCRNCPSPPKPRDWKARIHDALGQNPRPGPEGASVHTAWLKAGREPSGGKVVPAGGLGLPLRPMA